MLATGLPYLGMNTAGLFIHNLMEHAQRQAFQETRRCIEGRLKLEKENQTLPTYLSLQVDNLIVQNVNIGM